MRRQVSILFVLGPALLVACARLQHQTGELEPHALVCLTGHPDPTGENGVVNKIDGLRVRAGREYRVTPGPHTITVLFVDAVVDVYGPAEIRVDIIGRTPPVSPVNMHTSQDGKVTTSGTGGPFTGPQPVSLSRENRRVRYVDHTLSVQPGWRYELDGDNTMQRPLGPP